MAAAVTFLIYVTHDRNPVGLDITSFLGRLVSLSQAEGTSIIELKPALA